MNKFIGTGRIVKDPELKATSSGKYYLQNTLAIRNDFKNSEGQYDSEFVNIACWGSVAEYLSKYATKGSRLLVEGRLTNRSYEKDNGDKSYYTEVVCNSVELLDNKKSNMEQDDNIELESEEQPQEEIEEVDESDNFKLELPF